MLGTPWTIPTVAIFGTFTGLMATLGVVIWLSNDILAGPLGAGRLWLVVELTERGKWFSPTFPMPPPIFGIFGALILMVFIVCSLCLPVGHDGYVRSGLGENGLRLGCEGRGGGSCGRGVGLDGAQVVDDGLAGFYGRSEG
jgi:hypothetical protein